MRRRRLEVEKCSSCDIKTIGDYTLIMSNKWHGIRSNKGQTLLDPIYDYVDVMEDVCMCIVKVMDTYLLYDLVDARFVNLPELNSYKRFGYMLEVTTDDGVGLFSFRMKRLLVPTRYLETTHTDKGRYLWVKTVDGEYGFYDTLTAGIVKVPKATSECLDGHEDYMFVVVDNRVHCINETGNYDPDRLRVCALQNKGRIRLTNSNRHISIISDVYGNILNK